MNRQKIELLAPAGDFECLKAAISAGADAIYLSGKSFGARNYASNFNDDELVESIKLAHIYGVKIYITCNTLIYDSEIPKFMEYIEFIHKNNVDAVIIQDIGMADLIHQTYPNLEIHASTQMHIHNIEGVKFAKKLGIKRVVLARESSLNTIKDIINSTNCEIEIFAHGSLCLSYSGQCLISNEIGKRSANRGLCAGTCRLKYDILSNDKIIDKNIYPLSCKDLLSIKNIPNLIEAGIHSLKIEGRMKRKEYVYLTTSLYRKAIDNYYNNNLNKISENDITELKKIYNRGFTSGFLQNKNEIINKFRPNHLGIEIGKVHNIHKKYIEIKLNDSININDGLRIINSKEDIGILLNNFYLNNILVKSAQKNDIIKILKPYDATIGDIVLKTTDSIQLKDINMLLNNTTLHKKITIFVDFCAKLNHNIEFKLRDNTNNIIIKSEYLVCNSLNSNTDINSILKQLNKTKDTPYVFHFNNINVDKNIFIPIKVLNDLRRNAIKELDIARQYKVNFKTNNYKRILPNFNSENNVYYLIENNKFSIDDKYIIFNHCTKNDKQVDKLPRIMNSFSKINKKVLVSELGSVNFYKNFDTDFSLNVTNAYSVALLHSLGANKITLSYELSYNQINNLIDNYKFLFNKLPNLEVIIYGVKELMISKYNLYDTYKKDNLFIQDKFKNKYKVVNNFEFMSIYDFKISHLKEDFFKIGVNNIRFNLEYIDNFDNINIEKYIK